MKVDSILSERNKVFTFNSVIRIITISTFITINSFYVFSQSSFLDKKINVSASGKPLSQVLQEIKNESNLVFSYNSDILPKDHPISIKLNDVTIRHALKVIFNEVELDFKEIGDQIIITRKKTIVQEKNTNSSKFRGSQTKLITIYDTIITLEHDTITLIRYDTISIPLFDTIQVFDTIMKIEKLSFVKSINYSLDFVYSPYKNYNNYLSYPSNEHPESYSLSLINKTPVWDLSLETNLNLEYRSWILKTGVAYNKFSESINYINNTQNITESIIQELIHWDEYQSDSSMRLIWNTLESKFDTTWDNYTKIIPRTDLIEYSDFDTSYISDNKNLSNKIIFISIPLIVGKKLRLTNNLNVTPFVGIETGFIITKSYNNFNYESGLYQLTTVPDTKISSVILNWTFGTTLEYKLSNNICLISGCSFKANVTPIISGNYLINPMLQAINVKIGLRYVIN